MRLNSKNRRHIIGQNRGRMFILAGFSQVLGMLVFRALQVLKWFDFPVVSYVDAKLVCQLTKIKLVIFDDKHIVYMTYKHYQHFILFLFRK
jgi:hypothetical protein